MIFGKPDRALLVSPDNFSAPQLAGKKLMRHVSAPDRIFPAIHEIVPDAIFFDYDHFSVYMEKILTRIRANRFYNKTKLYCYKGSPDQQSDRLLRDLGVNFLVYKTNLGETIKLSQPKIVSKPRPTINVFEPTIPLFKAPVYS